MERLDVDESNWWRVKLLRSGQTGWFRKELLNANQVSSVFYFVKEDTVPILECPRGDCLPIQLLFWGDGVQRVEEGDQGWWRVLVIKTRSLGWVPAAALTERIEETWQKQDQMPYYYVALGRLSLRARPSNRSEVVRALKFNDQVQKWRKLVVGLEFAIPPAAHWVGS